MRMLLVSSDPQQAKVISGVMLEHGYTVQVARDTKRCHNCVACKGVDAVVLADRPPHEDGIEWCRDLRQAGIDTPVLLMLESSGNGAAQRAIQALDAGADDCMPAPDGNCEELLARVRALLRRGTSSEGATLRVGALELDLTRRTVLCNNRNIELRKKEFELLHVLIRQPGTVLSRTALGLRVWGDYFDSESNILDVCIHNLRKKIDTKGSPSHIRTFRGTGYMLVDQPSPPPLRNKRTGKGR